jgi:hypothetical protein
VDGLRNKIESERNCEMCVMFREFQFASFCLCCVHKKAMIKWSMKVFACARKLLGECDDVLPNKSSGAVTSGAFCIVVLASFTFCVTRQAEHEEENMKIVN